MLSRKIIGFVVIFFLIMLYGCFTDVTLRKGINTGQIQIGSSTSDVASIVGYPPPGCMKSKVTEDGHYEMWDYATRWCGSNLQESFVFIFRNNRLIEIRTVHNVYDMQW